ncbi:MAG TPA: ATP-binding cassette domain-containing protein [Chitinispirillaceae bacterium]|nr:ATP-binding cassette domain-containing protein [Chitinispirillaceae bacterium]
MITVNNVSLMFGKRVLFKEVTLKFTPGNCYGLIGANGSGKSTFLKILSGDIEPSQGEIVPGPGLRMAMLRQDHFAFDEFTVLDTVIMGHKRLYNVLREREILYAKAEMDEKDGNRASELEMEVAEMSGWEAESDAASLLDGLGIDEPLHQKKMNELEGGQKVRVLLAQALFGNPDILLLDEPTNNLDLESITWLEDFLYKFENTVIVVSHDRHFLNKICTHIADIDYSRISIYAGNYDFWYQASQLALSQKRNENKKKEEKIAELKSFIQRFSSNASKARQATSRKKLLDNLTLDEIPVSSRKFPYIAFKPERECGRNVLAIENLSKAIGKENVFDSFSLTVNRGDKIVFLGPTVTKSTLFQLITGELDADSGTITKGVTITQSYFPHDNTELFKENISIFDWLCRFSSNTDSTYIRGFLGRMLFSGDESMKSISVLSGGEKVRCLLSKMMLSGANLLILDEPTNHLDLESISALNTGLIEFPEVVLFTSHDHQFVSTIANRVVEFTPCGVIDRIMNFDDYTTDPDVKKLRDQMYRGHIRMQL